MNQAKILMGTLSLLLVAVVVSCTRNLSVPVTAVVNTPTPTATKTATNTNTPTGPTNTFTDTPTITNTSTSTCSNTPTSTNTATGPTATFTNTGTNTDTPTITNTPTQTDTPTITNTPTLTSTFTNTGTYTFTPTPTNTMAAPPTATPTTNENWDDFDEAPWTGWTGSYLVSTYTQNCTVNSYSINASTTKDSTAGALDMNVTFTATSGNLLEATIENGILYGASPNEQYSGVNPTYVSFWVYPNGCALATSKVWIDVSGTNYPIPNVVACPAGQWTNVVTTIPGSVPAMTAVAAIITDFTSTTATTVDCIIDSMSFYQ